MGRLVVMVSVLVGLLSLPVLSAAAAESVPPSAPQGLRAIAGDDGIGLTWGFPAAPGSHAVTGYRVYRDGGTEPVATPTGTTFVDPGAAGTTHTYTVSAVAGDAGEGARSAEAGATVPEVTAVPGPVTGIALDMAHGDLGTAGITVTGTPGVLHVSHSGFGWFAIAPASGSAWAPGQMRARVAGHACVATTTLTVNAARVHADGTPVVLDLGGDLPCGDFTGHVELRLAASTPLVAPDTQPDKVTAPVTRPGETSRPSTVRIGNAGTAPLELGAAVVPAGWTVSADGCSGATVAPAAHCTLAVAFAPVANGANDAAVVIPDNTPYGQRRIVVSGIGGDVPGAVRGLTAAPLVGRTWLTWSAPEQTWGAPTTYGVYFSTSAGGPFRPLSDTTGLTYIHRHGTPGQRLYYQVRAGNSAGLGAPVTTSVVSPGRELVYTAAPAGSELYHLHARGFAPGSPAARLTRYPQDEEDPGYSPGGKELAYTRMIDGSNLHLYLASGDGSPVGKVAGNSREGVPWTYRNPQWSPNGTYLAFACRPAAQEADDLCVRNMRTGSIKVILKGIQPNGGSWLPGSGELAVPKRLPDGDTVVVVVARDGSYSRVVPGTNRARWVTVSPDGSRFAWGRADGEETAPGPGTTTRYTMRVSPLSGGAGIVLASTGISNDPAWSADGRTVYFTHGTRNAEGKRIRDIYSAPAAGGALTRLTDTPDVDEDNVTVRDVVAPPPAPPPRAGPCAGSPRRCAPPARRSPPTTSAGAARRRRSSPARGGWSAASAGSRPPRARPATWLSAATCMATAAPTPRCSTRRSACGGCPAGRT